MRLTAKERILLHLLESTRLTDEVEVPPDLTQEGLARGTGIQRRHLAQFVRPLAREGLVREWTTHVTGIRQRRKVYALTSSGRASAIRLRERVRAEVVRFRDGDAVREGSLLEAVRRAGSGASLLGAARQAQEVGVVDLSAKKHVPESGLIEFVSDAPQSRTFVGRREELTEITREDGPARIFVIRGMPGVGKTALAGRACELVRGRRNLFWHRVRPWESDLTVLAALARFLNALDRPGLSAVLKRGDIAAAAEVLRQDLPGTHAFLVLDDAHLMSAKGLDVLKMLTEALTVSSDACILVLTRLALPFYGVRDLAPSGSLQEIELGGLRSEEAAALLGAEAGTGSFAGLGRRLAGHPLFLELVKIHRPSGVRGLRGIQRFFEEEIYCDLTNSEQAILKACCLYEVPVPQEVILSARSASFEALLSLKRRSLVRAVGDGRFEIQEVLRDVVKGTLSAEERRALGRHAVAQLRVLASEARNAGDLVRANGILSNALLLAEDREDRLNLCETLGDVCERIGDLLGLSTAYREGMALTSDPERLARLHRKLASALTDRGQLASALVEIKAGRTALGFLENIERGWLELVRARILGKAYDFAASETAASSALKCFERFDSRGGRAEALLELGRSSMWLGRRTEGGTYTAEGYLRRALDMAFSLEDPVLAARIHLASGEAIGYGSGDYEEGMKHFDAVERMPASASSPSMQAAMRSTRAWFRVRIAVDLEGAESDLAAGRELARRIHDTDSLCDAAYQSAYIDLLRGRYGDAGRAMEESGLQWANAGVVGLAVDSLVTSACAFLAAGNRQGYLRIASILRDPKRLKSWEKSPRTMQLYYGLDALVRRDPERFEAGLAAYSRLLQEDPPASVFRTNNAWKAHFYYSVGLRALGREPEANKELRLAEAGLAAANNRARLRFLASDFGERMAQTIRDGWVCV